MPTVTAGISGRPTAAARERVLTPEILALAAVVVLGAIMTILDTTIVNVALPSLGRDFHTSISTIQWVATIYLLAFASVIPLTGWASRRFGAKRVWLLALGTFLAGSLLSGLSWSIGSLLAFRALQGLGGGMIMPLGQAILAESAGPKRMGRVMSIVGVPMMLAPISGPVIGGALVGGASWRWIFFVNLPVGALALLLAVRLLPSVPARSRQRLDTLGLVLLSGGIAAFAWHALRSEQPLIDVRLFARRGFATAAGVNLLLGIALFGTQLLLALYFQTARGQSPLDTGLLLIPQAAGVAVAMPIAGALTDKLGGRRVVPVGVLLGALGALAFTQIGAHTGYVDLAAALFVMGMGLGATITPSMAVAFQDVAREAAGEASSALNTIQRVAGSLGTALLAVVLQRAIGSELPGFHGGVAQAGALAARDPLHALPALAHAFGTAFWVALALAAAALVPALLIPSVENGRSRSS